MSKNLENDFTRALGIRVPIVCGAMYPCSNPELIAAVSDAGGIGMVQPLSLVYVRGMDFRQGLKKIKSLTSKPFGMNALLEKSSRIYEQRILKWIGIALEEGCRFFITALGNPKEVVKLAKASNAIVYHDVTSKKWAEKALDAGVDGFVCVNNRAGGHAGTESPEALLESLKHLNKPMLCAGGVGSSSEFIRALNMGYEGVQMGTRFIATKECDSHSDYKEAILKAHEKDIVLTERVTGIPLSVIRTPFVESVGTQAGPLARFLLKHRRTKEWMRLLYNLNSMRRMKKSSLKGYSSKDYYQAGKSVEGIDAIESAGDIVRRFEQDARKLSPNSF